MVFVGRQRETSRIKAELAKRGNVVVSGTFGIGRTALIHHVAEEMGDAWRFIFLDFSHTPAQFCSDLIAWLRPRTAGRSTRRRLSFVSARAIVLKLEARGRRRCVLVLDNVTAVTAPKLALLRRLVATGRYRFVAITDHHLPEADLFNLRACLGAAPLVTLAGLPPAIARAFFAGVSGDLGLGWREGEVAALAEITDGYPLLMVEAIARARRRHAGGPDEIRPLQGEGAQPAPPSWAGGCGGRNSVAMAEFNENHRRRVLSTFRYLDQLLDETEHIMAAARSRSAFPKYVPDATPVQRKVLSDHISRFRDTLLAALPTLDLAPGKPEISMLRALRVQLITAEIALEELTGSAMRGYGPLAAASADTLDGVAAQLRGRLQAIATFLDESPDQDLHARIARLSATTDEVRLLRELERVVTAHGLVELRPGLATAIEHMESHRFEIAVFGRVSAGKSSLLNHLLQYDALPVGVTPITAVPIRVTFGREERVVVNFAEREPMVVPLSGLADVATEQRNPGNKAHVTQVAVELPAPRLASGVTFVDTPGLGSLAMGAEETLAYLPRCDLGLVLVDAASSPGPDELTVVRALYQAGATAAVLLSKADLLSPAERDQVVRHVQGLLGSECGVDVPVSPVSVVGAAAALADEWFDTVLQPLCQRQGEMAAVAFRRKVGALRDAAIASLRHRMERRPPESAPPAAADAREAAGGLAHAASLLEAASTRCATLAARLEGAAEQAIAAAATAAAAGRRSRAARQQAAEEALAGELSHRAETVAGEIAAALTQLRSELAGALDAAARTAPGHAAADLPRVSGLPVIDLSVLGGRLVLTRSLRAGLGAGWRRRAIAAQMRSQLPPAVRQLSDSYRQRLIAWSRSVIAEQRRSFDAQAEVAHFRLPAAAGVAAVPTGEKLAAMERDLALLAGWEREHEKTAQSNTTSAGVRADGGAGEP